MKIKFSRTVTFEPEFNDNGKLPADQRVRAHLTVLNLAELAFVGEIITKLGITKENASSIDMKSDTLKEMAKELTEVLAGHVKLENLEDDSGPVRIEDVATLAPYMTLALELLVELATISSPGEGDRKNLKEPSV